MIFNCADTLPTQNGFLVSMQMVYLVLLFVEELFRYAGELRSLYRLNLLEKGQAVTEGQDLQFLILTSFVNEIGSYGAQC